MSDGKIVREYYLDANRLHELLTERAKDPDGEVGSELGVMFLDLVQNMMKRHCYRNYTDDWKHAMEHNALVSLIKYTYKYDPVRGAKIRQEKNKDRKVPLKPVDEGKTAFNYCSWIANTAIYTIIARLNNKASKEIFTYFEGDVLSVDDVTEEELSAYANKGDDDGFGEIDPFEEKRLAIKCKAEKEYKTAYQTAINKYCRKNPTKIRKINKILKRKGWEIDPNIG